MTDKELHKLKRSELLELLFQMRTELDRLRTENETLRQSQEERERLESKLDTVLALVQADQPQANSSKRRQKGNRGSQNGEKNQ